MRFELNLSDGAAAEAFRIAERLKDAGRIAYFAGGCVRDALMQRAPQDFDIATTAHPDEVEKLFPKTIAVGKQFGVILVVEGARAYEVATFRKEGEYQDGRHPERVSYTDPKEDALRRDFTMNGLFYDPFEKEVRDFVGGLQDIEKKIVRAIGPPNRRFQEDKLRLLRAIRFASSLDFEIEPDTWKAVGENADWIGQVSPERIRDELVKIFTRPGAARGLMLLSASGLLRQILPEIEAMKEVQQPPEYHPEGDVFVHTKLLLEKLEQPSAALAFGALFHDVGKPPTFAIRNGKICFYEHAPLGAEMTEKIMRRLKFSNEEIHAVHECVANHMKFADVKKMRAGKLRQFVARPTFDTELELHKIDCQSSHGMLDNYHFLKEKLREYAEEELKPAPWINGHDLIAMGMKPGPAMKPLLEELYLLQLEKKILSREQGLAVAKRKIGN